MEVAPRTGAKSSSKNDKKAVSSEKCILVPKTAKQKERLQCPFCLKRFDAEALPKHKANCDCRTVHCQFCGKGRMARQLKTHEQFCDQNPKNATKSEKKKCKYCDKYFTSTQLAAHKCSWEPRQCKYCHMQIIARDIARHEEKCATKQSKRKDKKTQESSGSAVKNVQDDTPDEPRCCSFGIATAVVSYHLHLLASDHLTPISYVQRADTARITKPCQLQLRNVSIDRLGKGISGSSSRLKSKNRLQPRSDGMAIQCLGKHRR